MAEESHKVDSPAYLPNMSYKKTHELFVSNLNGTTMLDIATIVSSAPIAVLFRTFLLAFVVKTCWRRDETNRPCVYTCFIFVVDNVTLVLPLILAVTVFADYAFVLNATLLITTITCMVSIWIQRKTMWKSFGLYMEALNLKLSKKRPFISNYRAYVVLATAIGILAVDFTVFPRRLAKTETYGTGLMDVGVGAFIFSNAVVSHEAKGRERENHGSVTMAILKSIHSSLPLLLLGVLRCISVKSTEYQEHVSEYGTHWNFFFTLFFVKVLSTGIASLLHEVKYFGLTGVLLACLYQFLLSRAGLEEFILHGSEGDGSRSGIINANREGLCSCVGYVSLYFLSVQVGRFLFTKRDTIRSWFGALSVLAIADVLFWILTVMSKYYISPVSRRLCNLSFVLWQMAYNLQLLASFLLCDIIVSLSRGLGLHDVAGAAGCSVCYPDDKPTSERVKKDETADQNKCLCLIAAINRNQLLYFLVANVLTGIVNFSVKTVHCSLAEGFVTVCLYMVTVNFISLLLHRNEITFKFR